VNAITTVIVQAHIDELLAESAAERLARSAKPSSPRSNRFAGFLQSVWSTLGAPVDRPVTPTLINYPYR
jgi:hypothetical protein